MYALFKKEISNFLSSLIGIMVIVVFLLITGLFLWVFQSDFNVLNYGYAILRAVVARSLVASGLLPTLGIHHHNRYNAYCLADDIMEPYRPIVDKLVLYILAEMDEYPTDLSTEIKAKLLSIPVLDCVIDGNRSPLMNAVSTTTASLAKCYLGTSRKLLYPEV